MPHSHQRVPDIFGGKSASLTAVCVLLISFLSLPFVFVADCLRLLQHCLLKIAALALRAYVAEPLQRKNLFCERVRRLWQKWFRPKAVHRRCSTPLSS